MEMPPMMPGTDMIKDAMKDAVREVVHEELVKVLEEEFGDLINFARANKNLLSKLS